MAKIDMLKVLRGDDIVINEHIKLHQPTIGEIADFGEQQFFSVFYSLCSIPSDMKSVLWDAGIDWNKLPDWQLFLMLSKGFDQKSTALVFGDLDFSKMEIMKVDQSDDLVLVDGENIINEEIYTEFISYLREMIGYILKREKAGNKFTKNILIDEDRRKRADSANRDYSSTLLPLILSLVNTEEFSYTYKTVYEITIYQLMRSYYQIQNKKSACALYQGSMSGFVDTSKIDRSSFSWIYDEQKFK